MVFTMFASKVYLFAILLALSLSVIDDSVATAMLIFRLSPSSPISATTLGRQVNVANPH
jgi:hypothetical protein